MNSKASVPTGETGESKTTGSQGMNWPEAAGRDPMKGRRATGEATARIGTIRGGQDATRANGVGTGYNQKTGAAADSPIRSMAPRPSIPANQAETSKDLEARILANPQPFTYEGGAATLLPGSVRFAEVGIGYEYISDPDAGLSKRGYGVEPMGKQEMEDAASAGGGMPSKGYNEINGGRASWMRKD
jgi:hypothetical protein